VTRRRAEEVLFDDYAAEGTVSADGRRVLFTREGESWWRQGYRGSRAGQIWLFNRDDGSFSQVIGDGTECRWPLWKPDGTGFYYVSNREGAFNLWEHDCAQGHDRRLTSFKTDSVVFPALSRDGGTLVFRHGFDLYRWRPADKAAPSRIEIRHAIDRTESPVERVVLDRATGITFTQDGLQMAFVSGGDVWVMDTELREPRRVTQSAEEERDVVFAPDGKSLWFVSDSGGQTDVWKAVPEKPEKFWWENTAFTLSRITNDAEVESRLQFTRDGKRVAYVRGRGDIWMSDSDGQNAKRLIESWDAPAFRFSPDGAWLVYSVRDEWFNSDVWLVPVDGSRPPFNLSRHPNNDEDPVWSPDGRMIAWVGKREGDEMDIYYVWLRAEDHERTKRERTLMKAREKIAKAAAGAATSTSRKQPASQPAAGAGPVGGSDAEKPGPGPAGKPAPAPPEKTKAAPVRVDLDEIHERIRRVAIPNGRETGLVWSHDSRKLGFVATIDGKRGTYTVEFPDDLKPKLLAPAAIADAQWLKQDDQITGLVDGIPAAISAKGTVNTHRFRAQQSIVRSEKQRAVFDQCWRIMRDRYYDERLGNHDWDAIRGKYAGVAASAPDMQGVAEVVHLMLGELNGSHLGFTLNPAGGVSATWREETAHLGLRFDPAYAGPGWKVRDVLPDGPAHHRSSRIEAGEIVLQIDGREVNPGMDVSEVLNGPLDRDITLRVRAVGGAGRDVTLRPISYAAARKLLYDRWIRDNRSTVEKSSGGALGYLHISAMNEESFQRFQKELYAAGAGRDGLIIDVRENGGGSTADHLLTALTQPRHAITVPRGGRPGYPQDRIVFATWNKPVAVLCNQNSFSNAEIFSHAIKTLKRGPLIGAPTAGGVISTGAANIMNIGTLRLPFRGWYDIATGQDMELNGAQPDHVVWPRPGDLAKGLDAQLQKAIEVLKADVATWKQRPEPKLIKASERDR
jgi:tricorn protease